MAPEGPYRCIRCDGTTPYEHITRTVGMSAGRRMNLPKGTYARWPVCRGGTGTTHGGSFMEWLGRGVVIPEAVPSVPENVEQTDSL